MNDPMRVTAIVGSYRKGGVIDTAVDEILASARQEGAEATKIYLIDAHIEFCTNCRACTQQEGRQRGLCCLTDDMSVVLDQIERSDALVLASPMNFGTVTAVMKRFLERLVCFAYWPWGTSAPKVRNDRKDKYAVVVASSASPAFLARLLTPMVSLLKKGARLLGAKRIDVLFIGFAAGQQRPTLGERTQKKARRLGKKLVLRSRVQTQSRR
jgi:multimeric flavodoxin WrbA